MTTTVYEAPDLVTTTVEPGDGGLIHIRQVWAPHESDGCPVPERIECVTLFPAEAAAVAAALMDAVHAKTGALTR
ncbi:hypothetical protein [Raineyella sp. W15-4]|uniref:hypothetical protein n=1 Tax=Raineyella sp. W15-4 TaxID=3081651 RepID=UPI0029533D1A|nr:hypothetical protein [Raineyella sp. W15-4]WOQ15628.1 hypothetical protein R0145_10290 [Raineyella sp. W15-4]